MIRLSVFYPATEGASFDHDYYREKHVPLCRAHLGTRERRDRQGRRRARTWPPSTCTFESLDALQQAMAAEGTADVLADVANYTTIAPVLQTSEIVDSRRARRRAR